jgi:DNA replicative helicase MCM subunit Mcm2 (Cdc46/Mcm family)
METDDEAYECHILTPNTLRIVVDEITKLVNGNEAHFVMFSLSMLKDESDELRMSVYRELKSALHQYPSETFQLLNSIARTANEKELAKEEFYRSTKRSVIITDYPRQSTIDGLMPKDNGTLIRFPCIVTSCYFVTYIPCPMKAFCKKCRTKFTSEEFNKHEIMQSMCKSSSFTPKIRCPKCASTKTMIISKDYIVQASMVQKIIVKDLNSKTFITVFCFDEFADRLVIGQCAYITGIVHINNIDTSSILTFSIEALSIVEMPYSIRSSSMLIKKDVEIVNTVSKMKNIFPVLCQSIAPGIPCSSMIKAAILLALFAVDLPIHLLIISERKDKLSEIIKSIINIYPHFSLANELNPLKSKIKSNVIESGSVAKANGGLLIIDGVETLRKNEFSFIEACETGQERIDPCRVVDAKFSSITFGSVDEQKIISTFPGAMTLQDTTNLSHHTLACFTLSCVADLETTNRNRALRHLTPRGTPVKPFMFDNWEDARLPLERRLSYPDGLMPHHISEHDLGIYAAYARLFVKPKISRDVEAVLQQSIAELMKSDRTQRAEKSLRSLAITRAAIELRENVTESDVDEVSELMWWFHERVVSQTPRGRRVNTRGVNIDSKKSIAREFLRVFADAAQKNGGSLGKAGIRAVFDTVEAERKFQCVDDLVELLSAENKILLCRNGDYRLGSI